MMKALVEMQQRLGLGHNPNRSFGQNACSRSGHNRRTRNAVNLMLATNAPWQCCKKSSWSLRTTVFCSQSPQLNTERTSKQFTRCGLVCLIALSLDVRDDMYPLS